MDVMLETSGMKKSIAMAETVVVAKAEGLV